MTRFDELLRRGLMEANLAQYEGALKKAEAREPEFSPRYLRERMRLLADPWGWGTQRRISVGRRTRLNWRLIAILAALLLLSACAYAAVTGQFSQWFPRRGVNPKAPETSEEILSGIGTVIGQRVTVGDETVTLNAALWDGTSVWLSLSVERPHIPEAARQHAPLYTGECRLSLRHDQWESYAKARWAQFYAGTEPELSPEQLEAEIQARLDQEDRTDEHMHLDVLDREGDVLTLEVSAPLFAELFPETETPEMTLNLENIAVYEDGDEGESVPGGILLQGPFTFTFTLERPALSLSVRYDAGEAGLPDLELPCPFTGFELSTTSLTAFYRVQDPKELPGSMEIFTLQDSLRGLWTEGGAYVDLSRTDSGGSGGPEEGSVFHDYPYPIDPATVTAVNVAGVRVELDGLERLDG